MKGIFENNPFCKLLGIEYPLIQGGMAWVADANLAAAVSNAGGLGLIAAGNCTVEQLKAQVANAKKLTDKPFGVNIMLMSPHADDIAKAVISEGVEIVTTGAGSPAKYMESWLKAGIKVIPVVPSVAYAKMMERAGVHAVICEGCEAGGHIGELTTMTLVPQVCDAVSLPVAAAGGIADGRGIAAAFMLGAKGVQLGTRFLAATECNIHQNYKDLVIKAKDIDTIVTGKKTGHPVRALKNEFTRIFAQKESDNSVTLEEITALGAGALRLAVVDGDIKKGSFMAGQSAGLVKKEQTAKEMIEEMFAEFEALMYGK